MSNLMNWNWKVVCGDYESPPNLSLAETGLNISGGLQVLWVINFVHHYQTGSD